jgi:hypothetical protein
VSRVRHPWYAPGHIALESPSPSRADEHLWSVRKDGRTIEAFLRAYPDGLGGGVEVRFLHNAELIYDGPPTSLRKPKLMTN